MSAISLIGTILKERYCIIDKLGSGGGGTAYLARDLELGCLWAVKEIPLYRKKEAELLCTLEHDLLPCMIDYLEMETNCYLIMEYIRGKTLGELLREGELFSFQQIVGFAQSMVQVLSYLHTRKPLVCYGDLKPDNLILSENGTLYLIDLGSAVVAYDNRKKNCYGTKGYAAPEQYEGVISPLSDVFAFGKTVAELCGKRKWNYCLRYPMFGYLLYKCCKKKRFQRWKSMEEIRKQLERIRSVGSYFHFPIMFLGTFFLIIGIAFLVLWGNMKSVPFENALTAVTDLYYENGIAEVLTKNGTPNFETIEKELQRLLRIYSEPYQQRQILLRLAYLSEWMQTPEKTELYYEQLLLYDEFWGENYTAYGLFLCRQGLYEKSDELWNRYQEQHSKENTESAKIPYETVWEEKLEKWREGMKNEQ